MASPKPVLVTQPLPLVIETKEYVVVVVGLTVTLKVVAEAVEID